MTSIPRNPRFYTGGVDRVYYDTVVSGYNAWPLLAGDVSRIGRCFSPQVVSHWDGDVFGDVKWRIENHSTKQFLDNMKFPTRAQFALWKNANVPHDPSKFLETISLRPYDDIDPAIPQIDKMYGINRLYGGFVGHLNYRTAKLCGPRPTWDAGYYMLWEIFKIIFPAFPFTWQYFRDNGYAAACWCGSNDYRRYAMPKLSSTISPGNAGRMVVDTSAGYSLIPAPPSPIGLNPGLPEVPMMYTFDEQGPSGVPPARWSQTVRGLAPRARVRKHLLGPLYRNASAVIAFGLLSGPYNALYIKPLGIDQLYVNYFDPTRYRLEAVWKHRMRQSVHFAVAPTTWVNINHDQALVPRTSWLPTTSGLMKAGCKEAGWFNKDGEVIPPDTYFRLRDLFTGKVGRLSRSRIVYRANQTSAPCQFIIETAPEF